jgi:hypothetical protein
MVEEPPSVPEVSYGGDGRLPSRHRFGSEGLQCRSRDEVASKIERVVDGGMDAEEPLRRSGRVEALHFALPSAHGLMGVLGAIVLPEPLLVTAAKVPERRSVGTELVGRQRFRREAQFLRSLRINRRAARLSRRR